MYDSDIIDTSSCINRKERSRTFSCFNRYRKIMRVGERLETPFENGLQWYPKANERCAELARRIGVSTERMAGAAAILSPMTNWTANMSGLNKLVEVWDDYPYEWKVEVSSRYTTYRNNATQAIKYLGGDDQAHPSGAKVQPFTENLNGNLSPVTVDSWMFKLADFNISSITGNARRSISRAVEMLATLHGIEPAQAQAVVWTTARNWIEA
jgi:hypothetical protein